MQTTTEEELEEMIKKYAESEGFEFIKLEFNFSFYFKHKNTGIILNLYLNHDFIYSIKYYIHVNFEHEILNHCMKFVENFKKDKNLKKKIVKERFEQNEIKKNI